MTNWAQPFLKIEKINMIEICQYFLFYLHISLQNNAYSIYCIILNGSSYFTKYFFPSCCNNLFIEKYCPLRLLTIYLMQWLVMSPLIFNNKLFDRWGLLVIYCMSTSFISHVYMANGKNNYVNEILITFYQQIWFGLYRTYISRLLVHWAVTSHYIMFSCQQVTLTHWSCHVVTKTHTIRFTLHLAYLNHTKIFMMLGL